MHRKNETTNKDILHPQQHQDEIPDSSLRTPDLDGLFKNVDQFLKSGSPEKALQLISKSKNNSVWVKNATGVCQLRLGKPQVAIDIYRSILITNGVFLRSDAPPVFKINFAVALLMNNNLTGFYSALSEVKDEDHPSVIKLKNTVKDWKKKLTVWQKLQLICGTHPAVPIELGFPPGDLE